MPRRKSNVKKLKEGRGQGIGADYVPFYLANEGGSVGTSSFIWDPYEGRQISVLSDTEKMMYFFLRWNPEVLHIREQYPLDQELVDEVRKSLGYSKPGPNVVYTTDFLVDFRDGHQEAYSVKFSSSDFDPKSRMYFGHEDRYAKLIERQNTEYRYWESQGVAFNIVTRDDLQPFRTLIKNVEFVFGFWNEKFITTRQQRLLYLIAHHIVDVPMENELLNPHDLVENAVFDIDELYECVVTLRKEIADE